MNRNKAKLPKTVNRLLLTIVLCASTAIVLPAQNVPFAALHSFENTDGANPYAALVQGTNGNLYGVTADGGAKGAGEVFKITLRGTSTRLYSFDSLNGGNPIAGLVLATDGNFYGTTRAAGAYGSGTIFKITPSGKLTTLYSFCSQVNCVDGADPSAVLLQATDGNLYGTTGYGGAASCVIGSNNYGCGTVFKITLSGRLTTLHSFDGADGQYPYYAGLVQATDGSFYGTTWGGGANSCVIGGINYGCGTVFEITPSGTLTTLYNFCSKSNCTDGANPYASLVQATNGNFYGTTWGGGANSCGVLGTNYGCGTVFQMTAHGRMGTLYSFGSKSGEGTNPVGSVIQATDGNFYGTTYYGGANDASACLYGCGTAFKITSRGMLTTLYSFCSQTDCGDGFNPQGALLQDTKGDFYGSTASGGANGDGTVFGLSVGLAPFVETQPTSGSVGASVRILGTNLNGATSMTFNGTAAPFQVVSSSLISATVPAGATTGTVQVMTPHGTLNSNVPFRVQ